MTSNLSWEPANRKTTDLPTDIKLTLRKSFGGESLDGVRLNDHNVGYLMGLRDAGIEGAKELIDAIEKHEEIVLREEY